MRPLSKQQIRKLSKLCKAAGVSFDDYVDGITRESSDWKWLANGPKSKPKSAARASPPVSEPKQKPQPWQETDSSSSSRSLDEERRRKKHKKHKKKEEKKRHKKNKHKKDKEKVEEAGDEVPAKSATPEQVDKEKKEEEEEEKKEEEEEEKKEEEEMEEKETPPVDARSFFQQLQKQEAAKEPVGTVHSRGLPAPVSATAISTSDKWECSKAGCGHMNSKHAPACNKCGAMKRLTEWR
ncbi:hypothetical protein PF004_g16057 [Phytophthora fragariae]|uniref:RanBP2-type domain-containing protein n=1 Tax=Phytophthora fragariae TaxID=53985 RepID=A0A6G0NJF8_9STRA|nr:hypothetical protein PF004_g16057 [Phytophthora fragariae]